MIFALHHAIVCTCGGGMCRCYESYDSKSHCSLTKFFEAVRVWRTFLNVDDIVKWSCDFHFDQNVFPTFSVPATDVCYNLIMYINRDDKCVLKSIR